jgi:TolB-like protein/tetratricopeptide (TPR) repeat protein/DNA-binding winged helix-turn-helix (wHTH) protein
LNTELLQGFYLGDFFIEPLKGQVVGKGTTAHLPPKAAEVLLCLASSPGDVLSREDLIECVWGEGHGSNESLSHAVSEIRHALDDHVDNPKFVQTLPRRGYRLVVEPVLASAATDSIVIGAQGGPQDVSFFESLSRRGVIETALAYLVLGWLIIQVADIVFDQLHVPDWAGTFVTSLVIAGFPIALILSWFLEFRDGKATLEVIAPQDARRRRFSRTYISIICSLVLAAFLVFLFDREFGLPQEAVEPQPVATSPARPKLPPIVENSIAVLPFFNMDGGQETQTFANGLVDDVINRLARVPGLSVSARGDSFSLEPNTASSVVRERLRVAMYIEGSVEMAADSIRVIVQLIDSATGRHMQSRTFDQPRTNYFEVRDAITDLTVSSLRVALPDDIQAKSQATAHVPEYDAYLRYRRGIDELDKPGNVTTLNAALAWMDSALDVDPEYAAAYAGKCRAYVVLFRETSDPETIKNAEEACANALSRNPNLDVVHLALGDLLHGTGKYDEAEAAYVEALRINPKNVDAMLDLASVYRLQQRMLQAEGLLRNALGLQPGNWRAYASLANFYYRRGQYLEAADQYRTLLGLDSQNESGLLGLAASLMLAGDFESAAPVFALAIDVRPDATTYSNLGLMHYYLGEHDAAVESIRKGLELAPTDHLMWANLGDILTDAGDADGAQDAYSRARELATIELGVNPNNPAILMDAAWIDAMLGDEAAARSGIARAKSMSPDDPYASYYEGLIFTRYGDIEAALDSLEQAVANGYSVKILAAEPLLESLHDHARFVALTNTN